MVGFENPLRATLDAMATRSKTTTSRVKKPQATNTKTPGKVARPGRVEADIQKLQGIIRRPKAETARKRRFR
jgi:hypothetical protein